MHRKLERGNLWKYFDERRPVVVKWMFGKHILLKYNRPKPSSLLIFIIIKINYIGRGMKRLLASFKILFRHLHGVIGKKRNELPQYLTSELVSNPEPLKYDMNLPLHRSVRPTGQLGVECDIRCPVSSSILSFIEPQIHSVTYSIKLI